MTSHEFYMDLALQNARAMKGQTDPNPLVGSVIVNDSRIVGVGTHLKAGEPHAEIHALRMAGENARGGTIYVTLEPCSHHGRTGPCAVAIVKAGIKKVVIAALDPNPLVAGNGVRILEEAGIEVITGIRERQSLEMNEVFNKYIVTKKPFVTMKAASTLDGKTASRSMDSKWITSEDSRLDVHRQRNEHGAILVGVQTVLEDDPSLTARIPNGRNPVRIVMDNTLKTPFHAKVVADGQAETIIFTSKKHDPEKKRRLEERGIQIFGADTEAFVTPQYVLEKLGELGISSVLIEGGGTIHAAFLESASVDKVLVYFAPKLIGGKEAPTFLEGTGIEKMASAIEMANYRMESIGADFRFTGYPVYQNKSN